MTGLWDQFTEGLKQKNVSAEELLHATEAELEEIFTENGYRALERAQLRTAWYAKKSQIGVADLSLAASATVVAASSREFAEAKVLLDHYVCPSPGMSVSIVELERVTNTVLQKRFERRKSELSGGVNGVVVRRFHSPVSCTNQKIQDLGFTLPADGPQMCLRFLTKAPASHPPGAYKLLLCDVAVGKYKAVSGDSTSITPEQLVSEAYDSVYLFYAAAGRGSGGSDGPAPSPGTVAATTPDEFLLFHPDQVLPRHVVTFLVHPALSGGGSPSRSPPSPFSKPPPRLGEPPEATHEVKRELSFQQQGEPLQSAREGAPQKGWTKGASKYWLQAENQLVDGDSLLVGVHQGKSFVSLADGTQRQAAEIESKGAVLTRSIEHLRELVAQLDEAKVKEAEAERATIAEVEAQTLALQELLEQRKAAAIKSVQEGTSGVLGRIEHDHSVISGVLQTLEGYSTQVNSMLALSASSQPEFLLKSDHFLQTMSEWKPGYAIRATLSNPPPAELVFDSEHARSAIAALSLVEASSVRPQQRAREATAKSPVPARKADSRGVVIEDTATSTTRRRSERRSGRGSPDRESSKRSQTPQIRPQQQQQQQQQQQPLQQQQQQPQANHYPSQRGGSPPPPPHAMQTPAQSAYGPPHTHSTRQHHDDRSQWEEAAGPPPPPAPPIPALPIGQPESVPRHVRPQRPLSGSRSSTPNKRQPRTASRTKVPTFTIAVVGDACVGKTRLLEAWLGEDPPSKAELDVYVPSLEPKTYHFTAVTSKGKMNFSVVDAPGSQLFPDAMGGADAAVILFDCTQPLTYESANRWFSYLPYHIPVALCGNKSNDPQRQLLARHITFHKEVNAAIKETLVNYIDVSVATRYNVDKPWQWICRKLMKDSHLMVKELMS